MKSLYTTSPSSGLATSLMTYESGIPLIAGITERRLAKLILHTSQEFESLSFPGSAAFDITSVWLASEGLMKLSMIMCNDHSFDVEACGVDIRIGMDTILNPIHESNQVLESNHSDYETCCHR